MNHLSSTEINIALLSLGGLVIVLGLFSGFFKERLWISNPILALVLGVLLSPLVTGLINLEHWGKPETILEQGARLAIAIQLMGVALRLPRKYPWHTVYIFALLGLALPWEKWLALGWKGLLIVVAILLLRRLPAFLLLRPLLGRLKSWQDVLFVGWFGPIGAAAIFYAMLALRRTGLELPWVIGSLVICSSIIVHGFTAVPFSKFYGERFGKNQEFLGYPSMLND